MYFLFIAAFSFDKDYKRKAHMIKIINVKLIILETFAVLIYIFHYSLNTGKILPIALFFFSPVFLLRSIRQKDDSIGIALLSIFYFLDSTKSRIAKK